MGEGLMGVITPPLMLSACFQAHLESGREENLTVLPLGAVLSRN